MNTINSTADFDRWLGQLSDLRAKQKILVQIQRARLGNLGDWASVGEGVCEMRIHFGAGYRVYYGRTGETIYLLLLGGNKRTQSRDIAKAKVIWRELNR
jgi:putative addiction module killer protein